MKFWLNRETTYIYLDQLIKAAGIMTDYKEIVKVISAGKVTVNNEVTLKRRKMLLEGDEVRLFGKYIKIVGDKEARRLREAKEEPKGKIAHGRVVHSWKNVYEKNNED